MSRRPASSTRPRLSRDRIVATAVALADRDGIDALSMRRLAQELGVDPMSLYHHVDDKDVLLDAVVDRVIAEIPAARDGAHGWSDALRATILAARATLLAHPWAARVIATRPAPTPAALRHIETVLDILRTGGFSVALCHHALHVLGSRILGFGLDLFDDSAAPDAPPPPEWASSFPRVAELAAAARHDGVLGACDDDAEFAFALDLILDGLERRRRAENQPRGR